MQIDMSSYVNSLNYKNGMHERVKSKHGKSRLTVNMESEDGKGNQR